MPNLDTLTKLGVLNLYIEHFQSDSCFSSLAAFCFQTGNGRFQLSAKINLLTRHLKAALTLVPVALVQYMLSQLVIFHCKEQIVLIG